MNHAWILLFLAAPVFAANPAPLWELREGVSAPESAYVVPEKDWILISSVAGEPGAKDGNGWITKVSLDGKVLEPKWVAGLNAPKGMRAAGGKLYVADIDELVEIELKSAKITRRVRASRAKFLNDVAVDGGKVYVSDTMDQKIYRLERAGLVPFIEGDKLESPNGLFIRQGAVYVASWGAGMAPDWSTKTPGGILSFSIKTQTRREVATGLGNLDGLEWTEDGWLVSDWVAGKVFRVKGSEKPKLLLEGFKGAADIGWHARTRLLIVPRMNEDIVSAYKL